MACKVQYCRLDPSPRRSPVGCRCGRGHVPARCRPALSSLIRVDCPFDFAAMLSDECGSLRRRGAARSLLAREVWAGGREGGVYRLWIVPQLGGRLFKMFECTRGVKFLFSCPSVFIFSCPDKVFSFIYCACGLQQLPNIFFYRKIPKVNFGTRLQLSHYFSYSYSFLFYLFSYLQQEQLLEKRMKMYLWNAEFCISSNT